MKRKTILFFVLLLSLLPKAFAQLVSKDTLVLKDIEIKGNRAELFTGGVKSLVLDSSVILSNQSLNLAALLEQQSTLFIKSYGVGGLATTSFRGASAAQTAVLWNGFTLQSPMNGLLDLALVPVSFVDQLKIQFGGCGALWGSGSVSGTLHLQNQLEFNKGASAQVNLSGGSFSKFTPSSTVTWSGKNSIVSVKGFYAKSKNNFPFRNTTQINAPQNYQSNAALLQYGYMVDSYLKLNSKNQLNFRLWQQYSNREIPPIMVQAYSDAQQIDRFVRFSSEFQHARKKSTWNVRMAYFNEYLHYLQQSSLIDANNQSKSLIAEAETKQSIGLNGLLNIGINATYGEAVVDNYVGIPHQNRSALFSSFVYSRSKYRFNIGVRKELITGTQYEKPLDVPLMPYTGVDLKISKVFTVKSNISRNYRVPTFNDLFWVPGGNRNLSPEQGWSEEMGIRYFKVNEKCTGENCKPMATGLSTLEVSSTVFNRNINDWIMWVPETSYWVPKNILKVWSRGIENVVKTNWKIKKVRISAEGVYDYVLSTNEKVPTGSESELHKQLIYVPLHKAAIRLGVNYKSIHLNYMHNYTGWVFTQADNEAFLDGYWLGTFAIAKKISFNKQSMNVYFNINNCWNKSYQVLAFRAMPGRNFEFGVTININK